jgi:hypothetical protein
VSSAVSRVPPRQRARIGPLFLGAFRSLLVSDRDLAENLRGAAHGYVLRPWTELLTSAVARACGTFGWEVAAKGVGKSPLPFPRFECLGLDVTAFEPGSGWRPAIAAFELENASAFDKVAYALWKVASVKTRMAGLFCFRREPDEIGAFVEHLADEVMRPLPPSNDEFMVIAGTRSSAETFPDGYFRVFEWNLQSRRFVAGGLHGAGNE